MFCVLCNQPYETSVIENSHHDPVYDVFWISSKTGNLCASVSTDGRMLWWDTRRLGEPTDELKLDNGTGTVHGGSSLAYNTEAGPTKVLRLRLACLLVAAAAFMLTFLRPCLCSI
jgi:dynein intermediate chain 2, axonemal